MTGIAQRDAPAHSSDRLVMLSDGVVAIAMTLLVLPLVDLVTETKRANSGYATSWDARFPVASPSVSELLAAHAPELGGFLLSFLVIVRLWWGHHRLFLHVSSLERAVVGWNVAWLLSVAFLPFPTAVITTYACSPATVTLYIGTLVVASSSLSMLTWTIHQHPGQLSRGRPVVPHAAVVGGFSAAVLLIVAMVVGAVSAPALGYSPLALLLLSGRVERLVGQHWRHRPTGG